MNYSELLQYGQQRLTIAGIAEAETDTRLLLEAVSGKSRTELYLTQGETVGREEKEHFFELLSRRCRREPVAYIVGKREFWSLSFHVSRDVLIPRWETEFLLETVLAKTAVENLSRAAVLDLCTGSGVIAVVLAKELVNLNIVASDISLKALAVASNNIDCHRVEKQVALVCSDLLQSFAAKKFSLIVSNPPYVTQQEIERDLAPDVSDFEPHLALNGGSDGLVLIRQIESQLHQCLLAGGEFFMEFGAEQGEAVVNIFSNKLWSHVQLFQDYAGRDRVLWARKL